MTSFEYDETPIIISRSGEGKWVEKLYAKAEFSELLAAAAKECLRLAVEHYCELPLPESFRFLIHDTRYPMKWNPSANSVILSEACFFDLEGVTSILLGEDGFHLSDLRLTPFGQTNQFTAIEVCWGIYGWTNLVLEGHSGFPFPPFIITGPTLPLGYNLKSGERIKLAEMEIVP